MNIAVRYYSRTGNTKILAEAIAKEANTEAISVDSSNSSLNTPTDLLFVGGALYAYGLDKHLKEYLKTLSKDIIKKAVVFSTSWISKHSVELIKKELESKSIDVSDEYIYIKNKPNDADLEKAKKIVKKYI